MTTLKKSYNRKAIVGVMRNSQSRIAKSSKAISEFKKSNRCPAAGSSRGACPGYVIDHTIALKNGGADAPSNMQWQTIGDVKAKDKWEVITGTAQK